MDTIDKLFKQKPDINHFIIETYNGCYPSTAGSYCKSITIEKSIFDDPDPFSECQRLYKNLINDSTSIRMTHPNDGKNLYIFTIKDNNTKKIITKKYTLKPNNLNEYFINNGGLDYISRLIYSIDKSKDLLLLIELIRIYFLKQFSDLISEHQIPLILFNKVKNIYSKSDDINYSIYDLYTDLIIYKPSYGGIAIEDGFVDYIFKYINRCGYKADTDGGYDNQSIYKNICIMAKLNNNIKGYFIENKISTKLIGGLIKIIKSGDRKYADTRSILRCLDFISEDQILLKDLISYEIISLLKMICVKDVLNQEDIYSRINIVNICEYIIDYYIKINEIKGLKYIFKILREFMHHDHIWFTGDFDSRHNYPHFLSHIMELMVIMAEKDKKLLEIISEDTIIKDICIFFSKMYIQENPNEYYNKYIIKICENFDKHYFIMSYFDEFIYKNINNKSIKLLELLNP